jgi:hypothetical protein
MSHYAALWMILYADQVIISGQPSKEAITELLYTFGVGKHTSVVYINKRVVDGKGVRNIAPFTCFSLLFPLFFALTHILLS